MGSLKVEETDDWYEVSDDEGVHAAFIDLADANDYLYMKTHSE